MRSAVSVTDVAARAGVSLGTVSNVLNRPERVAPATRARVRQAIEDLGFVRNEAARQLRAGRSRTIGFIVRDLGNPFLTDLAGGVERVVAEHGLSLVLCNSDEQSSREDHYLSLLEEQRVYGILLVPALASGPRMDEIRGRGTPIVLIDHFASRDQCSVSVDDVIGGQLAVRHLIELGHRRIAFVGGRFKVKHVGKRLKGARNAFVAADRDPKSLLALETDSLTVASGRQAGQQIAAMSQRRRPTAVFCANDLVALGLLQEMTGQGIKVPSDIAIVGYDDIDFAASAAVPLTSVGQPRSQVGKAATELLMEEAINPTAHTHRQVVFAPELVIRASTASSLGRTTVRSSVSVA